MSAGPRPSNEYLAQSNINAERTPVKLPLLVILDLNGCLVARKGSDIELCDDVKPFLQYLLHEHWVMIWSSATATSVQCMIDKLFTTVEEQARLVAIWDKSHLDLTVEQYHSKPQVYKRLSRVWGSKYIQRPTLSPLLRNAIDGLTGTSTIQSSSMTRPKRSPTSHTITFEFWK